MTRQAMFGATTLIIAISACAALLPALSIIQAAFNVNRRACSIWQRASAMRSRVTPWSETGRPKAHVSSDRGGNNLDIWVQHLETKESRRLTTHTADDREPSFSPDGSRIAFRSERDGGGIYLMSTLGGEERRIADGGRRPKFSPDGKWIAYFTGFYQHLQPFAVQSKLYVVAVSGGQPRELAPDFRLASEAAWSADSKTLLVYTGPISKADWYSVALDGSAPVKTGVIAELRKHGIEPQAPAVWTDSSVLFPADLGDARNVWHVPFDSTKLQVTGAPKRLTSGTNLDESPSLAAGRLVFSNKIENPDIWSLPMDSAAARVAGEPRRVTEDLAPNINSSVSADGKFVAYSTQRGQYDVVWKSLVTQQERVLATTVHSPQPRISADGRSVAFNVQEGIRIVPETGGPGKTVGKDMTVRSWTQDGKRLVVTTRRTPATGLLDLSTGEAVLFLPPTQAGNSAPRPSPDARWVVLYQPVDNDHSRMFLVPARTSPVPENEWIALNDGAYFDVLPEFSPDGKIIYFLSQRDGFRCHWAMRIDPATGKRIGDPFPLQHYHSARVSPAFVRPGRAANGVARDKIVFTMAERTGNIWMAELPQ